MTSVLLMIDMQLGLCEGEGCAFEADAVIARIDRVAEKGAQRILRAQIGA